MFDKKEDKNYSKYVKEQMASLKEYDYNLFEDVIQGLKKEGWVEKGGSDNFRILSKEGSTIKVFRNAEAPEVIHVCFSAPPENFNNRQQSTVVVGKI